MTYIEGPYDSGIAHSAIGKYLRVKFNSSGKFEIAGDEQFVGVNLERVAAADDPITVKTVMGGGTVPMIANGAIAVGATVTTAAGGKVASGTLGAVDFGRAKTAATADGDEIQVYIVPPLTS